MNETGTRVPGVEFIPMGIVTKAGDDGETGLLGRTRLPKSDVRFHAIGTVDELNALLGAALAGDMPEPIRKDIVQLQHLLFLLGADLAAPEEMRDARRIRKEHVRKIEEWIEVLELLLSPLSTFILPGGTGTASRLHVARAVCRRAERWAVALSEFEQVNRQALIFLNRVGDYLFLAARAANRAQGEEAIEATY